MAYDPDQHAKLASNAFLERTLDEAADEADGKGRVLQAALLREAASRIISHETALTPEAFADKVRLDWIASAIERYGRRQGAAFDLRDVLDRLRQKPWAEVDGIATLLELGIAIAMDATDDGGASGGGSSSN